MELSGHTGTVTGSLADYRRNLVKRIVHKTVADLAQEKGIAPEATRMWSRLVAQAEKTASAFERTLSPSRRARRGTLGGGLQDRPLGKAGHQRGGPRTHKRNARRDVMSDRKPAMTPGLGTGVR